MGKVSDSGLATGQRPVVSLSQTGGGATRALAQKHSGQTPPPGSLPEAEQLASPPLRFGEGAGGWGLSARGIFRPRSWTWFATAISCTSDASWLARSRFLHRREDR